MVPTANDDSVFESDFLVARFVVSVARSVRIYKSLRGALKYFNKLRLAVGIQPA